MSPPNLVKSRARELVADDDVRDEKERDFDEEAFLAGRIPIVSGDVSKAHGKPCNSKAKTSFVFTISIFRANFNET